MGGDQVDKSGAMGLFFLAFGDHQKIPGERHGLPAHQEEKNVIAAQYKDNSAREYWIKKTQPGAAGPFLSNGPVATSVEGTGGSHQKGWQEEGSGQGVEFEGNDCPRHKTPRDDKEALGGMVENIDGSGEAKQAGNEGQHQGASFPEKRAITTQGAGDRGGKEQTYCQQKKGHLYHLLMSSLSCRGV